MTWDQRGSSGGGKKWSDSGYISKLEPTRFPELGVGCERKRAVKYDSNVFGLSNWMDKVAFLK